VCLQSLAVIAFACGAPDRSARLFGAAAAVRQKVGAGRWGRPWLRMGEAANAVQLKLGRQRYEEAWAAGGGLSLDQAMIEALSPEAQRTGDVQRHGPLTAREWQVALLITDGFTNRRIGDALVITEGTAALHVRHVLNKLGFDTRAQIAAWVTTRR